MSSILSVENLEYKDILNGISFDLEENSFNILLGENGSGKTTLIKCLLGLIKHSGTIIFSNNLMCEENKNELIKSIGVVLDTNVFLPGTVLYNITYPLINLDFKEDVAKKKAYEISKKLGLNGLLLKDANDLSLSEKKLVSFAVAIVHSPKLIIIDDSLDELDEIQRGKILNYLKGLNKSTKLFVSSKEEDIILSDYLIILKKGKISVTGKTLDIVRDEKNFTKNNVEMPFLVDLSHKLKSYSVIEDVIFDEEEMVNEIWK